MAFTDRMKEARLRSGLTQEKLAKMISVAKSTYTGYEKGNSEPNMLVLSKIMDALGVDANYLFQDEVKMQHENRATPDEMENLVKRYRALDIYGKEVVDSVLDIEHRRVMASPEPQATGEWEEDNIIRFPVPQYQEPMSAGTGDPIGTAYAKSIELAKEPPRGTSFIAQVHGDSMEPDYPNGSWVFVHSQVEIRVGEVGVFYMGGKEWIKVLGENELISINPKYNPQPFSEDIRCQGLVIGICDESYFE